MKKLFDLNRVSVVTGALVSAPAVGTETGTSVDTLNYRHGIFHVAIAGGTGDTGYTITVEHSDDDSTFEDAGLDAVTGTAVDGETNQENVEVTLKSLKRYVRVSVEIADNAGVTLSAVYALGDKDYIPSSNEFLSN